jgi:hypothetical protein
MMGFVVIGILSLAGIFLCLSFFPAHALASKEREHFNVMDYGAKGDGSIDDAQAIQLVINKAQSIGGGKVFFPAGIYRISTPLQVSSSNVVLEGVGTASVLTSMKPDGAIIKIGHSRSLFECINNEVRHLKITRHASPDIDSAGIVIERARYITVESITVYNQGIGIAVGVSGEDEIPCQWVFLKNIFATGGNFPDAAIRFFAGAGYEVTGCCIEPSNRGIVMSDNSNGIYITQTSVINGSSFEYAIVSEGDGFCRYISNVNLENALKAQLYIGGVCGNKRITISGCWLGAGDQHGANTRSGIVIEHGIENVTIVNNRIGHQCVSGIISRGSQIRISGNVIEDNSTGAIGKHDGISIREGNDIILEGNIVKGFTHGYGISTYDKVDDYIISNNVLRSNGVGGLSDKALGKNKTVQGNIC